ncbi:hypothetical protein DL770_011785 [Monosporascus sp. CRB-9-2]|nr:hypothetical protein DL770_011785 [Monosporascus sp. CRB-9-2]
MKAPILSSLLTAETLDRKLSDSGICGPMHGIRFVIKDNIHSEDKHNTPPFALGGGGLPAATNFPERYSVQAGQIRNPFNPALRDVRQQWRFRRGLARQPSRYPIGTGTHGSLVHHASNLGLYTLESTPGLKSRHGVVPGPMARSVKDAALLLDMTAGPEQYDNLTWNGPSHYPQDGDSAQIANDSSLNGLQLGLPWNPYWSTKPIREHNAAPRRDRQPVRVRPAGLDVRKAQPAERVHGAAGGNPRGDGGVEGDAQRVAGVLGNTTRWHNTEIGQDFYDIAVATSGGLGDAFRTNFGWDRRTARAAVDDAHAHAHRLDDGKPVELDALLVPNDDISGGSQAYTSMPSYAEYPVASVPAG